MPGFFLKLGTLAGPVDITGVVLPANTLTAAELQGVFKMSDGWYHALANETTFGSGTGATAGVASFTPFEVVFPASTETIQLLVDAASHKVYPTAALIATTTQGGGQPDWVTAFERFTDCTITALTSYMDSPRGNIQMRVSFGSVQQGQVPTAGGVPVVAGWDLKANKKL
jgi:hypothetical protein